MTRITDPQKLADKADRQLSALVEHCGIDRAAQPKLLEIGFKNGYFLEACRHRGIEATGTEINAAYYASTRQRSPELDLVLCEGQTIPLPDATYDYVVSFQVLEHVASIETVLRECLRVLKPGGLMYHVCPNYQSFYEGHYKVIWCPYFNRAAGRAYLKLLGRYKPHYETLNLVKPGPVARVAKQLGGDVVSVGKEQFLGQFNDRNIELLDVKLLQRLARGMQRLGPISHLLLRAFTVMNWHYPIRLIARKP